MLTPAADPCDERSGSGTPGRMQSLEECRVLMLWTAPRWMLQAPLAKCEPDHAGALRIVGASNGAHSLALRRRLCVGMRLRAYMDFHRVPGEARGATLRNDWRTGA